MNEMYLKSRQLSFRVLQGSVVSCQVVLGGPHLVGRRTKGLEFYDDDQGFVNLGMSGQLFNFLQAVVLSW